MVVLFGGAAYASEPAYHGYIPMDWDSEVKMTDEDISYEEALDRIVIDDKDRVSEDGDECALKATDYTPRVTIPAKFPETGAEDMEALEAYLRSTFPSLRNQGSFGTCWAHSVAALGEFFGIKNHGLSRGIDLSELYLALSLFNTKTNRKVGNAAEGGGVSFDGNDRSLINFGGNLKFAGQLLLKGYGFVKESDLPYISSGSDPAFDSSGNLGSAYYNKLEQLDDKEIFHLSDLCQVDITTDNGKKIIKEAILRNGAVGVSYRHSSSYFYDNETGAAFFCDTDCDPNHAVCIVGWDDDYIVGNFNPERHPENSGAWLIRNSWCSSDPEFFGRNGYFWMSYEDKCLQPSAYIYETSKTADGYDNVYYYDTQIHQTGHLDSPSYPDLIWYSANVFKGPETNDEILNAVSIETGSDTEYEVKIYTGLKDPSDPESGTHVEEADTSGILSFPGIYTISLNSPVALEKGKSFSVVAETKGQTLDYECSWSKDEASAICRIEEGQSFFKYKYDGINWADMKSRKGNFCISAYTSDVTSLNSRSFTFTPPSGAVYDGTSHAASVTTPFDVGNISVFYNSGSGWSSDAPVLPGTYRVKVSTSGSEKYAAVSDIEDESWSFTIDKGKITVTADDKTVKKGDEMPELTYSVTGFTGGDPFTEKPVLSCTASDTSTEGIYEINVSGGTLAEPALFDMAYVKGKLTVTSDEDEPVKPGPEKPSKEELSFPVSSGEKVSLIHDTENNTYETANGEQVVALSTASGNSFPLSFYEYTGKKITPGKKGYVIYEGVLYRYKKDYTISFKKNKKPGTARAVIKWKRKTAPRLSGIKKSTTNFEIRPRAVTADMVNIALNKKGGIKKLTIHVDGLMIKTTKKDYICTGSITEGFSIVFKNNFTGTVEK